MMVFHTNYFVSVPNLTVTLFAYSLSLKMYHDCNLIPTTSSVFQETFFGNCSGVPLYIVQNVYVIHTSHSLLYICTYYIRCNIQ
jgi:hypothetical protein